MWNGKFDDDNETLPNIKKNKQPFEKGKWGTKKENQHPTKKKHPKSQMHQHDP